MSSDELRDKRRGYLLAEGRSRMRVAVAAIRRGDMYLALYEQGVVMGMAMAEALSTDQLLQQELADYGERIHEAMRELAETGGQACPAS